MNSVALTLNPVGNKNGFFTRKKMLLFGNIVPNILHCYFCCLIACGIAKPIAIPVGVAMIFLINIFCEIAHIHISLYFSRNRVVSFVDNMMMQFAEFYIPKKRIKFEKD